MGKTIIQNGTKGYYFIHCYRRPHGGDCYAICINKIIGDEMALIHHFQTTEYADGSMAVFDRRGTHIAEIPVEYDKEAILAELHRAYEVGITKGRTQKAEEIREKLGL